MAQDYHDLIVWQRAIELTVSIYSLTRTFPREEMYGLISQMRRASVSVASNIAEGRGRLSRAEFRQFLGLAQGSIFELGTQLVVAKKLGLVTERSLSNSQSLADEVSKMIRSFIRTLVPPTKATRS